MSYARDEAQEKSTEGRERGGLAFNHVMLYVQDVARATHFYGDLLGFRVIEQFPNGRTTAYARLRAPRGSSTLALHLLEPGKSVPEDEGVRLYFEARNLEAVCGKLEGEGVKLLARPKMMPWGWKHAYLKDPDGHLLSLYWAGEKRFRQTTPP